MVGTWQQTLRPERVVMRLQADAKAAAIRELLDVLDRAGVLGDRAEAERVVFERERMLSTGMGHGIAIPHGKTAAVNQVAVAVGLSPAGIAFEAMDGAPVRIVVLVVSPAGDAGTHLRVMAGLSRALNQPAVRDGLLAAPTPAAALAALLAGVTG
ncbi:MAG: PTS sugar transporter subunit IIA [Lentisphaeria bacterium]